MRAWRTQSSIQSQVRSSYSVYVTHSTYTVQYAHHPFMIDNCTQQSAHKLSSIVTQEQSNKGDKGGVVASGCCDSVAECWRPKPEALGSIPDGTTFLSFPLPLQRSLDSNSPDYLWLDDLHRSSDCVGESIHWTPHAVITLTLLSWSYSTCCMQHWCTAVHWSLYICLYA